MNDNKKKWTKMHNNTKYRPKYPAECVVQYVFRNFLRNNTEKVLDLGCGAGRHTVFMANEGIIPYGMDFSENGVYYTKELLKERGFGEYKDNICTSELSHISYPDNYFDGIICYGVLYYLRFEDIKKAICEMHRVLKTNGKVMIVVRSLEDYRVENSLETDEKNTFIICESNEKKCAHSENNMIMHFFERKELTELMKKFINVKIDRIVETHDNENFMDSNYIVTAVKGEE